MEQRTRQWRKMMAACIAVVALLSACGGSSDSAEQADEPPAEDAPAPAPEDAPAPAPAEPAADAAASIEFDDDRPEWLPAWVQLPEGLVISTHRESAERAEAAISGIVLGDGGDPQVIFDQTRVNVESAGYVISDFEANGSTNWLRAEHPTNGSVGVSVSEFDAETVSWNMDFTEFTRS